MTVNSSIIRRSISFAFLLLLAATSGLRASSLDSALLGMFPRQVTQLGYADLAQARQFPWFPQLESQLVPVSIYEFEEFLKTAQTRPASGVDQVAWAQVAASVEGGPPAQGAAAQLVIVASGHFQADTMQSFLQSRNAPNFQVANYTVYASGIGTAGNDVYIAVIDPETIAFGHLNSLKRILKIRRADEDSLLANEEMMSLIDRANGEGVFWGVLDRGESESAIRQMVPEAANFAQAADLVHKMGETLIVVKSASNVEVNFTFSCASASDAGLLSQLLQAGLLYKRYESSRSDGVIAQILDGLKVLASNNHLDISIGLTDDQVLRLVENDTFVMPVQ